VLVLGVDTSGKSGGIALAGIEGARFMLLEAAPISGGTFSAQLIPLLAELLTKHKLKKEDLGGFAVASGPGSFTGLRIGLAAVKGLAEILNKPIAAVSVLEAVAIAATETGSGASLAAGKIVSVLDAQRGQVFFGEYEVEHGRAKKLREELASPPDLIAHLRGDSKPAPAAVTPDATVAKLLNDAGILCAIVERPGAAEIARIGAAKIARGETVSVEELDANYLRNTDAEIFAKP
jgi:tRNA threonylcarbamoyladenosine biosynthesis protein TsaB